MQTAYKEECHVADSQKPSRNGHGCQTTLLRLLEDWKTALDKNQYVAAILMYLSKAFDCLPHDILLCKLSAYAYLQNLWN
jgi:hypothetical protein